MSSDDVIIMSFDDVIDTSDEDVIDINFVDATTAVLLYVDSIDLRD